MLITLCARSVLKTERVLCVCQFKQWCEHLIATEGVFGCSVRHVARISSAYKSQFIVVIYDFAFKSVYCISSVLP